ncbi:hypothetical protein DF185_10615 [Marinifilum breve]|uniref:Cardiolipin synthase N-terminal domain-containing protein n=1 Tax=Marinifilum breve TaxID=2184082 RepID=A0A2V3ZWQ1_9BACT|nr:hypothetical protein DF185_10615 [Marinifilum breve]
MELVTPELGTSIWIFLSFIIIVLFAWLFAIVHIIRNKQLTETGKLLFLLLVLFVPLLGSIIYLFVGNQSKIFR